MNGEWMIAAWAIPLQSFNFNEYKFMKFLGNLISKKFTKTIRVTELWVEFGWKKKKNASQVNENKVTLYKFDICL